MPLYEGRHNASNKIQISQDAKNSIVMGEKNCVCRMAEDILGADGAVALDGWYGVDFAAGRR